MNDLFLISKLIHILSVATWVGGMIFVAAVLAPKLRKLPASHRGFLFAEIGRRFSRIGWAAIVLLVASGLIQTLIRAGDWTRIFQGTFGTILAIKLIIVALLIVESIVHDFVLGPKQTLWEQRIVDGAQPGPSYQRLRKATVWLARTQLLGALAVITLGVILTRTGF